MQGQLKVWFDDKESLIETIYFCVERNIEIVVEGHTIKFSNPKSYTFTIKSQFKNKMNDDQNRLKYCLEQIDKILGNLHSLDHKTRESSLAVTELEYAKFRVENALKALEMTKN